MQTHRGNRETPAEKDTPLVRIVKRLEAFRTVSFARSPRRLYRAKLRLNDAAVD